MTKLNCMRQKLIRDHNLLCLIKLYIMYFNYVCRPTYNYRVNQVFKILDLRWQKATFQKHLRFSFFYLNFIISIYMYVHTDTIDIITNNLKLGLE